MRLNSTDDGYLASIVVMCSSKHLSFFLLLCLVTVTSVTAGRDEDCSYFNYNCKMFPTNYIDSRGERIETFGNKNKEIYTFKRHEKRTNSNDILRLKWISFKTSEKMPWCHSNYVKVELG